MKLIVGLGNPGREYEMTRHNLGFMLIDRLNSQAGERRFRSESSAKIVEVVLADQRVLLVKPQTYMNLSGNAVRPLLVRYGDGEISNLVVASDDVALPLGMIRVRPRGSAGGQKGLKSIIEHLGSDVSRLRIGVGRGDARRVLADHVLARFDNDEADEVERMTRRAADAAETFVTSGIAEVMNLFNGGDPETTE